MEYRNFGRSGVRVSALGFGAMHFDGIDDESVVGGLLNAVVDSGVNVIDTARGYGRSEERIGRHLSWRRHDFVLSTKFGYGVDGVADWTYECIVRGVDRALALMRTEFIDVGHLHSCPLDILQRGEVIQALADCVRNGKLRVAAYSGENAELAYALADTRLGSVQTSLSLVDQANIALLPNQNINSHEQGVFVKRVLGAACWQRPVRPDDFCEGQYYDRWLALSADPAWSNLPQLVGDDWASISLRFAAFQPSVSSVLIGTRSLANLTRACEAVARGSLPVPAMTAIQKVWHEQSNQQWTGII